jgi:hypothetical protein
MYVLAKNPVRWSDAGVHILYVVHTTLLRAAASASERETGPYGVALRDANNPPTDKVEKSSMHEDGSGGHPRREEKLA